ncbi:MAG TPA: hypothetical protein VN345_09490 [Blastocatellia bacterium]|jgi:hypothetical protein|nr:hypothetical protein [Blastocatellia bacterium]
MKPAHSGRRIRGQEEVTMVVAGQALIDGVIERVTQKAVSIIRPSDVSEYLVNHADLTGPVELAAADAAARFAMARLSLQLYQDPEIDDHYLVLTLSLDSFDENVAEAIANMHAHLATQLVNKSGWLQISPTFRV